MKTRWTLLILFVVVRQMCATGYYGPMVYLDDGGKNVDASPEFYWDLEVKRLARDFKAANATLVKPTPKKQADNEGQGNDIRAALGELTAAAERDDFEKALSGGEIKPPDVEGARKAQQAARAAIASIGSPSPAPLPQEFASEFSDYHRGAFAFRQGEQHYAEARDAWMALLKRPAQERRYRTVWATFMLGKLALKTNVAEAPQWFRQTRELAGQGFVDSLGMAADSFGWEGRAEWKQDHLAEAAKLFLTQLSLGDESAVVSLKALVPDRDPIAGILNYNVIESGKEDDQWEKPAKKFTNEQELSALRRAAGEPLLRRLVTAHILATASVRNYFEDPAGMTQNRARRWLDVIKAAKLSRVEDAEYLGWIAYMRGDYKDAAHWLKLADPKSPVALWLKAKLARREGKISDAAQAMAEAWETLRDERTYSGWQGISEPAEVNSWDFSYVFRGDGPVWSIPQEASGDLGAFRLQRADFIQALDVLFKAGLWDDAAYVAERVLTTDELKRYVDGLQADAAPPPRQGYDPHGETSNTVKLRYLLGRRFVREDRYDDAAQYLKPPYDQLVRRYADLLRRGGDQHLAKNDRARAFFQAAWIARYEGMELMGSEMAPDGFTQEGQFPVPDLAKQRLTGKVEQGDHDDGQKPKIIPAVLKATPQEVQRLVKTKIAPDIRFHYRVIAGALAMKAAALLPNNSEETADVINMAGKWIADRDNKTADRYFMELRQRASATALGRAAVAKRWFVDQRGPWSAQLEQEDAKLKKELGIRDADASSSGPEAEAPQPAAEQSASPTPTP